MNRRDTPDEETSDWRAVCGRTARTVRREGRPKAFPTPIPALGADGAKDVGGIMAVIAHHQRARAHRRPDIGVASLLADAGFVLEPDFYRCAGRGAFERLADQVGKVS